MPAVTGKSIPAGVTIGSKEEGWGGDCSHSEAEWARELKSGQRLSRKEQVVEMTGRKLSKGRENRQEPRRRPRS